jgi:hypothetical protein
MAVPTLPFVTPELARSARDHFQRFYAEPQTDEDGREMATNVLGAFAVWNDWRVRRAAKGPSTPLPVPGTRSTRGRHSPSTQE